MACAPPTESADKYSVSVETVKYGRQMNEDELFAAYESATAPIVSSDFFRAFPQFGLKHQLCILHQQMGKLLHILANRGDSSTVAQLKLCNQGNLHSD